jgi:hypothetical protein
MSRDEALSLESAGLACVIEHPLRRRDYGLVKTFRRQIPARGLSCRVGDALASAVYRKLPWARLMLAEITLKPLTDHNATPG